jgi:hypothetical protein
MAGPNCPMLLMIFLVIVRENLPDSSIQSAAKEIMFEQIHIDKYGSALKKPF